MTCGLRALVLAGAILISNTSIGSAQMPAPGAEPGASQTQPPAATPSPAPAAPATPEPAPPTVAPPAISEPPPPPPPPAASVPPAAPSIGFGEEATLTARTIVFLKGNGTWDNAFETLVDAFKSLYAFLEKQGLKHAGPAMTIYTQADDTGFTFQAAVPIAEPPKDRPSGDMGVGDSPAGKAYKFVHRGSYDSMDNTYEAITNFLDQKRLEAQDFFVEEYETDPVTTPDDKLIVNVYVPIK
jgi:effector-binding domain-containing protein